MIDIPNEIKELFLGDNIGPETRKKFKLTFYEDKVETLYPYETLFPSESLFPAENGEPWLVIENDHIESESLVITESLSETDEIEFGSCAASMAEIVVADVIEDVTGREFALTVEIGGYELALGIYTVESFIRQADRRKRKITAYDRMRLFNIDVASWYNELKFPMTLGNFRNSLCDYIGIEQDYANLVFDNLEITKTIEPSEIQALDILKNICEINGCFGHINRTGELTYIRLQQTGLYPSEDLWPAEDLYPAEFGGDGKGVEIVPSFKSLVYEDYTVEGITGLVIRQEENDIGANVGYNENPYAVEGNFLAYGKNADELLKMAEALLPQISGRTYRPSTLECPSMPWIEVGDFVRAHTTDDIVETFVMKRVISGCQAMMDSFESTGSRVREGIFGVHKQIIQLEGKAAVITKNVEQVSVDLSDLKEDTNARFEITDEKINAKVSKGTVSSELSLEPDQVVIRGGRLIVESTNFNLNGNGDVSLTGTITANAGYIGGTNGFTIKSGKFYSGTKSSFSSTASGVYIGTDGITLGSNFSVSSAGAITAKSGKIANYTISENDLISGNVGMSSSSGSGLVAFWAGSTTRGSAPFRVTNKGELVATNATVTGTITASSGTIANYTIKSNELVSGKVGISSNTGGGEIAFWAGSTIKGSAPFRVTNAGILTATNVDISGTIFATGGKIGDWLIEGGSLVGVNDMSYIRGGNIETSGEVNCYTCRAVSFNGYDAELDNLKNYYGSDWKSVTKNIVWLVNRVNSFSDEKVKKNIQPIDSSEALDFLLKSNPITFQYTYDGHWSAGCIAQEVDALQDDLEIYFPLVETDERTGYYMIKYQNYIPIIISAIQNLQEQVSEIKRKTNYESSNI